VLRLRFDVEVLNLLPNDLPAVQGLKLYLENFSNARELIITLQNADAESTESAARTLSEMLRAATNLTTEVNWQPPWVEHPGQAAELIAYLWLNQPPAVFGEFTNKLASDRLSQTLEAAREALATSLSPQDIAVRGYDPFGLTRLPEATSTSMPEFGSGQELFASSDGTLRLVFVQARDGLADYRACAAWLKSIQQIVQDWRAQDPFRGQIDIRFTGRPAFVAEISSGMQKDMAGPSVGTLVVIALLFYYAHRRWKPLVWLIVLLLLILASTLALSGLFFGTLNVVSLGFASILLGLAEDFGIVLYQESRSHPDLPLAEVQREAAPGIFWSAVTTSGAFLLLNLSGLPGLAQLGTLVAIGVGIAAVVMLYFYLPPLLPKGTNPKFMPPPEGNTPPFHTPATHEETSPRSYSKFVWGITACLGISGMISLWLAPPTFDRSPNSLRPKHSQAYAALEEIKARMNRPQEPQWVVVRGRDEKEVADLLREIEPILERAAANGLIKGGTLPTPLWPQPENQAANRPIAAWLASQAPRLRAAAMEHGFTPESFGLTGEMLATWSKAAETTDVFWPGNDSSHWILEKLTAHRAGEFLAIGLIHPSTNSPSLARLGLMRLANELPRDGVLLSGWELLGATISEMVMDELPRVMIPIGLVVLISLWLAFRHLSDVVISIATLVMSGVLLMLIMNVAGWSWNMMNLMALPLLLGMGVDFSIHIQLALHRHHGNLRLVRDSIGRALLLAGSTTVAGFASVAFSSNAGIASLGKICATGIACSMLTSIYLLPVWWKLNRN
jgi:predicted RND superfamily exporter protein